MAWWTMFLVPRFDERNIVRTTTTTRSHIERPWSPQKRDTIRSVVSVERRVLQERLNVIWQDKFFVILRQRINRFNSMTMRNRVNKRIEIKCWQVGIFCLDVDNVWCVIPGNEFIKMLSTWRCNCT